VTTLRRRTWRIGGLATLLAVLCGCESTVIPPIAGPTAEPLHQVFGPAYPAAPPPGDRVRIDDASLSADSRTLTADFIGGPGYSPTDFCSTDYEPWVGIDGDVLLVGITKLAHPEQATAGPNMACAAVGYPYSFDLRLPGQFLGSTVRDLGGSTLWVREPRGLVTPRVLPAGWDVQLSQDEPTLVPALYVRVYAPAGSNIEAPNRGAGQLDLYQAFGAPTNIGGGSERHDVVVQGQPAVLWRDAGLGELLLQFVVAGDGVALVANEADLSIDELLKIADGIEPSPGK
jgi:hypothetical protein